MPSQIQETLEPLKEMFNENWFRLLAAKVGLFVPGFRSGAFLKQATRDLEALELNQRMRRATETLKRHLPDRFPDAVAILKEVAKKMPRGYTSLVFPDYVGQYGRAHFDLSMEALAYFTSFGSSEFAVREFLREDFDRAIRFMYDWAEHHDHHVRRLASEGSRPALPWSFRLRRVTSDPTVTRPILEKLKADPELYVRKSVANHLNDISKFDPEYMLQLIGTWDTNDPRTAWIVRHASRTLIKKGHPGSLAVLAFENSPRVAIRSFRLSPVRVRIGSELFFEFVITSLKKTTQRLVVDYRVHYVKKNGTSVKVFKLKEIELAPGDAIHIEKKQRFTDFTTRTHTPGRHRLEIQVNGRVVAGKDFMLTR